MELFHQVYVGVMSVLTLGVLIFVHELGHFLVAKWCRVTVLEFSVGFGKILWSSKRGETLYALRLIPLGGYVKMLGDDPFEKFETTEAAAEPTPDAGAQTSDASANTPQAVLSQGERAFTGAGSAGASPEALAQRDRHFLNQSLPEKAAVVIAGPLFNYIFAFILATGSAFYFGVPSPVMEPVIGHVTPKFPAAQAGILAGDKVISVDGVAITAWLQLADRVRQSAGKEMTFIVERQDAATGTLSTIEKKVLGRADSMELNVLDGTYDKDPLARPYRVGIAQGSTSVSISFSESVSVGWYSCWRVVTLTGKMLGAMFNGAIAPSQALGGPVAVFAGAAQSASQGLESIIGFMVLLSVSLALFNLLPIPILDGGHLLFFLIEAVKGGPLNTKWLAVANQVGLAFLLMLMLFAVSNDLLRIFT